MRIYINKGTNQKTYVKDISKVRDKEIQKLIYYFIHYDNLYEWYTFYNLKINRFSYELDCYVLNRKSIYGKDIFSLDNFKKNKKLGQLLLGKKTKWKDDMGRKRSFEENKYGYQFCVFNIDRFNISDEGKKYDQFGFRVINDKFIKSMWLG